MDEYTYDLLKVAPSDDIEAFNKYVAAGKKIQAVKILRKYNLIEDLIG